MITISCYSAFCLAQSETTEGEFLLKTYVPVLSASPSACEVSPERHICRMAASLIWEVPKAGDYCIYFIENAQVIQCWENQWAGVFNFTMYASSNAHFFLIRNREGSVAAKARISVQYPIDQQENAQNKKGFWRIF